jgi:hypothetical protein
VVRCKPHEPMSSLFHCAHRLRHARIQLSGDQPQHLRTVHLLCQRSRHGMQLARVYGQPALVNAGNGGYLGPYWRQP